jgi:hypothetical protein
MIVRQYVSRLNVNSLTPFHPDNELKADALNSHLLETEEFLYLPQNHPSSLARRLPIGLTGHALDWIS